MNEALIATLETLGWFAEMPPAEAARLRERLESDPHDEGYLLLAALEFDPECIESFGASEERNSYSALIAHYAQASGGRFHPTDIHDALLPDGVTVAIGFRFAGRDYRLEVPLEDDWFDPAVHTLINEVLEAAGVPQRFCLLPVIDQVFYAAFVSEATFERAVAAGVFPNFETLIADEFGA